jgi:hypothetical protein
MAARLDVATEKKALSSLERAEAAEAALHELQSRMERLQAGVQRWVPEEEWARLM